MYQSHSARLVSALASATLFAAVAVLPVAGQDVGANASPAMLRSEYLSNMKDVEEKVVGLAEAFPEEKYAWRPAPGVRSVSEVLMHIASEHYVYMPMTVGAAPPADLNMGTGKAALTALEKVTAKAEVIRHLKASFAYQRTVLETADAKIASGKIVSFGQEHSVANLFNEYIADQHEHLGQLIAYARMNGVVPPWSKKSN
ncbi:MAG: DinB family protein [Gemmatimonadota bacterium]